MDPTTQEVPIDHTPTNHFSSKPQSQSESQSQRNSPISLTRHPSLVLHLDTPKGRGVFATTRIPAKTLLETCPVLLLGVEENREHIEKTSLFHYTYNWPLPHPPYKTQAVVLGLGSMFNHSTYSQNVVWERDISRQIITYRALRDIEVGEELCISYGSHLTFADVDAKGHEEVEGEEEVVAQFGGIEMD
ncbi:SET domain-containing protein [Sporormia fimetaria CBS 119925]|uniref:SET domain-containing protein n=1 Tax=Sporormia fimetaria CBS 119925 TaxID=1340428 RepID=A0A6A6V979_9PLEO|nr:SET domain-containing protein [Sporormia fimetaria CBS 119925]